MRIFKIRCFICGLFLALCLISSAIAEAPRNSGKDSNEDIMTNFEVIDHVSERTVSELISNMPGIPGNRLIRLHMERSSSDFDFVFTNKLVSIMKEAGYRVTTEKLPDGVKESNIADYRFSYQLLKMSLRYPAISRKYWIGEKQVEREAQIAVFSQLVDLDSGDIVWVGETRKSYQDVIPYSDLDRVEDPSQAFTMPERHEVRWSRLVEPIVVGGIVTGLIYLFFSNQDEG